MLDNEITHRSKPFYTLYMVEGNSLRFQNHARDYEEMQELVAKIPVGEIWIVRDAQGYNISMAFNNEDTQE